MTQESAMLWAAGIAAATTVFGLIAGGCGHIIMSYLNHKRELEKIAFETKLEVLSKLNSMFAYAYENLFEVHRYYNAQDDTYEVDFPYADLDEELERKDRTKPISNFISNNQAIIPDKIINMSNEIINKFNKKGEYNINTNIEEISKMIKKELSLK